MKKDRPQFGSMVHLRSVRLAIQRQTQPSTPVSVMLTQTGQPTLDARAESVSIGDTNNLGRGSSGPHRAKTSPGRPPAGPNGEKTSTYPQMSARVPPKTRAKVRELSRALHVPQWRIIADAVDAYSKRRR